MLAAYSRPDPTMSPRSTRIFRPGRPARSPRSRPRPRSHHFRPSPATTDSAPGKRGHRSTGGRRGVSIGLIVALVAVVVVVGTVIVWSFFGDALSHRGHTAAARCVGGNETVAVVADPSIADHLQEFVEGFNTSAGPVGDRCVSVSIKPAGSDAVLNGLANKWPAELGGQPALWIPGSSISAARLAGASGQKAITDSRSLVTSPVLLAVRPELQLRRWQTRPGPRCRACRPTRTRWRGLNLPAWGSLRLALPSKANADAASLAGEAVAAASVPAGAPPTQGVGAVRTLIGAQPELADSHADRGDERAAQAR